MSDTADPIIEQFPQERFSHLSGTSHTLATGALAPRWLVYASTAIVVVLAWIWLGAMVAGVAASSVADGGPATFWINEWLAGVGAQFPDNAFLTFLIAACSPFSGGAEMQWPVVALLATMWFAMSLAMMLPSAAPMLRTYADIADVAASRGQHAVPLTVLALGYASVWAGFSLLAAVTQFALMRFGGLADAATPVTGWIGASLLFLAGLYQFSGLKEACLEKCRNPFSVLFGQWSDRAIAVYRLGLQQGLFCLGCCWALMLVMLVVGTMNLVWMAFFTLFAVLEKSGSSKVTSRVTGGILIAWGAGLAALSLSTN